MPLPKHLFYDADPRKIDLKKHEYAIIERVLHLGTLRDYKWLKTHVSRKKIIDVLKRTRRLDRRSAWFWAAIFNVRKNEVKCLQKSFRKRQRPLWPH